MVKATKSEQYNRRDVIMGVVAELIILLVAEAMVVCLVVVLEVGVEAMSVVAILRQWWQLWQLIHGNGGDGCESCDNNATGKSGSGRSGTIGGCCNALEDRQAWVVIELLNVDVSFMNQILKSKISSRLCLVLGKH